MDSHVGGGVGASHTVQADFGKSRALPIQRPGPQVPALTAQVRALLRDHRWKIGVIKRAAVGRKSSGGHAAPAITSVARGQPTSCGRRRSHALSAMTSIARSVALIAVVAALGGTTTAAVGAGLPGAGMQQAVQAERVGVLRDLLRAVICRGRYRTALFVGIWVRL